MPRRPQYATGGQKGKDGKRPRRFHRGIAQGKRDEKRMEAVVRPAYARADDDRQQVAATSQAHRVAVADWQALLDGLQHAAPYVPAWRFAW